MKKATIDIMMMTQQTHNHQSSLHIVSTYGLQKGWSQLCLCVRTSHSSSSVSSTLVPVPGSVVVPPVVPPVVVSPVVVPVVVPVVSPEVVFEPVVVPDDVPVVPVVVPEVVFEPVVVPEVPESLVVVVPDVGVVESDVGGEVVEVDDMMQLIQTELLLCLL